MLCCLNPNCSMPQNPDGKMYCQRCNTQLIPLLRGHYRIIKVLSDEGGFGRTYLSEDIDKLNELCVVKQFAPKVQENSAMKKAVELFKQEAQRLQHLGEHHQIPTLLAYFEQDNYLFLVQQFINGNNLLQELRQGVVYNESTIVEFLLDLLPVLKYIHERGVIHRDIKPQNIIRRQSDGGLVLIDFGAAKQLKATMQTQLGTTIGSLGYTPIEQMQYGKAYPASDLFSLGATCFHLLTGINPSNLFVEQGYSWVESWQQYWNTLDSDRKEGEYLVKVLNKLLETDIQRRYQSADEVMNDLIKQRSLLSRLKTTIPKSALFSTSWSASTSLTASTTKKQARKSLNGKFKQQLLINTMSALLGLVGVGHLQSLPQLITKFSEISTQPYTLKGHASDVNSVAFSPNGEFLASGSDDKTIKVWNLKTKQKIHTLPGHSGWVWAIAFSPDGKTLVSAGADKTIKLWNLATGTEIRTLKGHSQGVASVAFSPDGKTLASGSLDKTIKLWNLATGKEIRTLSEHSNVVANVAFSPDGKTLASGSWDKTIKLWNLTTNKVFRTLEGHSDLVMSVVFNPDGKTLASASKDKTIRLWNLAAGKTIRTLKGHSDKVNSVVYVPRNSTVLASGSNDNTIKLWNLTTGEIIRTLKRDSGYIYSVAISPDGRNLASGGSAENIIKIWPMSW
ncbi:serine/threonine protein kinase with WD40 repeats [Trichormus variabilis ATCC 29413]|uniref:Serine/threonine protein kinase with WD40 repeats n=2 Tax=Anabaena variabilis TaxID=264691 RepID=Q3M3I4_TRIV2|nr:MULTISPECIES: serine/threonine-protein kinase [Nostocaceae]ABA24452.1 serine/threonine protein kinase with WD40 repeats [Trichormus variabilis ATCC 29413]MBC1216554.1 serine/threonine protein kinase [Trichormus variabilis ARAD]MBC1256015.1 serine/threonine protein kinase [Trichormus variabilis V5]MBC1267264.1 serine/threonine protein kinase [Trichormus variabilis FSR]MBC1302196.1 serine/threonine protein kinase [Trichormus variabilis N2B]